MNEFQNIQSKIIKQQVKQQDELLLDILSKYTNDPITDAKLGIITQQISNHGNLRTIFFKNIPILSIENKFDLQNGKFEIHFKEL